jgi:hypothetical protein
MAPRLPGNSESTAYTLDWPEAAVSGLPEPRRSRHVLTLLSTYIDDSGSENKGPVFVMAGYLSRVSVWSDFSTAWAACLGQGSRLPYFKMKEAFRLRDCFNGWTEETRDQRVSQLVEILSTRPVLTAVVLALSWDDFWRAKSEFPALTDVHPYDMLFHGVMHTVVGQLIKHNISESVEFVFDEQGKAGERAILTYKQIKAVMPPAETHLIIGSPRLADDKQVLPLQAADLLAWQVRRYVAEQGGLPIDWQTKQIRLCRFGFARADRGAAGDGSWGQADFLAFPIEYPRIRRSDAARDQRHQAT